MMNRNFNRIVLFLSKGTFYHRKPWRVERSNSTGIPNSSHLSSNFLMVMGEARFHLEFLEPAINKDNGREITHFPCGKLHTTACYLPTTGRLRHPPNEDRQEHYHYGFARRS